MIFSDYHLHTCFSGDSDSSVNSMIEQGISLGLTSMCITDHFDYDYPSKAYGLDFDLNLPTYYETLVSMKEYYSRKIELLIGIELGLDPSINHVYRSLLYPYNFDFIIGSTHLIDNMDPYFPDYFDKYEKTEGIRHYYDAMLKNMQSSVDFDVCGHIDYIIRYAPNQNKDMNQADYRDILDELLTIIIQKGKGIELNTAGFKYGLNQPHPHPDILKRYKELGGTIITIGSDGHTPGTLAFDFQKVPELLKSIGFSYYTIYKNRVPIQVAI